MKHKKHSADRALPSGLYDERPVPPQLIDFVVESGAMRSKTEGYIPAIVFTMKTDDGQEFSCMMRADGDEPAKISTDIMDAAMHARRDVSVGFSANQPGQGKSHG